MNAHLKHVEPFCVLFNSAQTETSSHLFKSCNFSKVVWFGIGISMSKYNGDFYNWVKSWFTTELWVLKETFSIICWKIWNHRNDVNFNKAKPNPVECIKDILSFLEE